MNRLPLLILIVLAATATLTPIAEVQGVPRMSGRFDAVLAETDESLYGLSYFKSKRVVICGSDGMIIRSTDAGVTWNLTQYREGLSFRAMHWVDERMGFVAGRTRIGNVLLKSTDGGDSFRPIKLDVTYPIRDFAFLDKKRGYLVCGSTREKDGAWRMTTDGGETWTVPPGVAWGITGRQLNDIDIVGKRNIWVAGSHVEIALVGDAARSLLYQKRRGGVLHSDDEGESFEVLDAGNPPGTSLWGVSFSDLEHGFVVGDGGFAARTADAGKTWTRLATGTGKRLRAVDAVDATTAYMVGDDGVALGTNDGGESIVTLETKTKKDLRAVSFLDERTGFAVGQTGVVLRFVRTY
jgi:photosystem II stability/assembly factor-like uncharacterized protein